MGHFKVAFMIVSTECVSYFVFDWIKLMESELIT